MVQGIRPHGPGGGSRPDPARDADYRDGSGAKDQGPGGLGAGAVGPGREEERPRSEGLARAAQAPGADGLGALTDCLNRLDWRPTAVGRLGGGGMDTTASGIRLFWRRSEERRVGKECG